MKESLSDYIKKEINEINIPEEKLNHRIEKAMSKGGKRNLSLSKKIAYGCSVAVVLFGLFVGSAFVSPVMAEVVSKIPYLGQLIASKSIGIVISEELGEKGYQNIGVGVSYQGKKEISVTIDGTQNYFDTVKEEVENVVIDVLESRGYDAYSVEVSKSHNSEQYVSDTERNRMEAQRLLGNAIIQELENHHFSFVMLSFTTVKSEEAITIELPNTVSDEQIQDIKNIINDVVEVNNSDPYLIKVKKIDMVKKEQEGRWGEILTAVGEDLMGKQKYKVTGLAYSVYPSPELIIKTSIKSVDSDAKEFAENLEAVVVEFLETEEMVSMVKNDSYIITIRSKDGKKIN